MKRRLSLDGKTWTKHSLSVWNDIEKTTAERRLKHPAMFPIALAERLISCFSHEGDTVLDPFLGSGTTLMAAGNMKRVGIGIELSGEYFKLANKRIAEAGYLEQEVHQGNGLDVGQLVAPENVSLCVTSPPYWDVLKRRRSADHRQPMHYGNEALDLGSITDYAQFIEVLGQVFDQVYQVLKPGGFLVVVVMDVRKGPQFFPLHMDLATRVRQAGFLLDDIIIWDRRKDYSSLRPLGYPYVFRVNKIHEYLLIFQKPKR